MTERQRNFLKSLVNTPAPSGYEEPVQEIWKKEVSSFCRDIRKDIHGSLTAVINAGKDKSLMIVGHSDEVGLIVHYINDDGFIYVRPIGGIDHNILPSQRARILTKRGYVDAIIARTSLHLLNKAKLKKKNELHEIWLDIGAKNKKDAERYISVGDPVIFGGDYMELQNGTAVARCWDNRVGIYIVAETLRNISKVKKLNHTVYGVSSVQEETGVWGAANPAYTYKPYAAVAVDVIPCTDQPEISKERFGLVKLFGGPVITKGVRSNNKLSDELISLAEKRKIPHQIDVDYGNTWTDADPISQVRGGIAITVLSVPTRYLHSSVELLCLNDIDYTVELLTEFVINAKLNF